METDIRGKFLEQVNASRLTPEEKKEWTDFAANFDGEDLRPIVELINERPGALERLTKTSRLERRYLESHNPEILSEIREDAHLQLGDLMEETGFALKE